MLAIDLLFHLMEIIMAFLHAKLFQSVQLFHQDKDEASLSFLFINGFSSLEE